jgi:biopolymer transport protein ExbD
VKSKILKKFLRNRSAPGLVLTPLLDMFTIILIFLIVSFEAEDQDFHFNETIDLPESSSRSVFKPAVSLAVTEEAILVEQKPTVEYDPELGRPAQVHFEEGQIPALVGELETQFDAFTERKKRDPEAEAIILVQADKDLDYDTLYLVLRSASVAGFSKYRLATMKK